APRNILKRRTDIIQCCGSHGHTISERLSSALVGAPAFIHSQGPKPWGQDWQRRTTRSVRESWERLRLDLSPYTLVARKYRENLDSDRSWMQSHSTFGSLFRGLGLWYPPLVGLPFAAAADLFRLAGGFSSRPGSIS